MSAEPAIYDIILLLDPSAADDVRAKIISDTQEMISAGGEVVGTHPWGVRQLAFEIDHKAEAEYTLIQFHATARELLEQLVRTLHITDGVMRFRIVKLEPGTPPAPDMRSTSTPAAAPSRDDAEPVAAGAES